MRVTHSDQLVLGACCEVLAIGAEAHATNVQIAVGIRIFVRELTAEVALEVGVEGESMNVRCLVTSLHVEDLCFSIAPRGQVFAICGKLHAAYHTAVPC